MKGNRQRKILVRQCRLAKDVARVFYDFRQNMSRTFAADFGKKRCEHLGTGGYAPAPIIPSLIAIAYVK